jgi:peptidoglycan hydrolase CwlO-like protein
VALTSPEFHEFRGENADQLNALTVHVLNLTNFTNILERRNAALQAEVEQLKAKCGECPAKQEAAAEAAPKAPARRAAGK